jgi:hypothetical protein
MIERKKNFQGFRTPLQRLEKWQISGEAALVSGVYRLEHDGNHLKQEELLVQKGVCLPFCECGKPIRFHLIEAVKPIEADPDFS